MDKDDITIIDKLCGSLPLKDLPSNNKAYKAYLILLSIAGTEFIKFIHFIQNKHSKAAAKATMIVLLASFMFEFASNRDEAFEILSTIKTVMEKADSAISKYSDTTIQTNHNI
jgi:hypothetical protein